MEDLDPIFYEELFKDQACFGRLSPAQENAIKYIYRVSRQKHEKAKSAFHQKVAKLGYGL